MSTEQYENLHSVTGPLKVGREENEDLTTQMVLQWTLKGQWDFFWGRKKEEHLRKKVEQHQHREAWKIQHGLEKN